MHVTFFEGDQTNCFPCATHDFSWEGLQKSYRIMGEKAPGAAKASRGYAIFARLRPATEESLARIQARRRQRGTPTWSPSIDQRAAALRYGYRDSTHLVEATALVCDYDDSPGVPPTWDPKDWPCAVFAHSTHNYDPVEAPGRWRVIVPVEVPIPVDQYDEVRKIVQGLLPPGCYVRAAHQPAYLPTCPEGMEIEYASVV